MDMKLLKIASDIKFTKKLSIFSHSANKKNPICGDKINIKINLKKNIIKGIHYETKSCIYCQASASFLAYSIKQFSISDFKRIFLSIKEIANNKSTPKKYKKFGFLFSNKNRIDCVLLPFNALVKACKIL